MRHVHAVLHPEPLGKFSFDQGSGARRCSTRRARSAQPTPRPLPPTPLDAASAAATASEDAPGRARHPRLMGALCKCCCQPHGCQPAAAVGPTTRSNAGTPHPGHQLVGTRVCRPALLAAWDSPSSPLESSWKLNAGASSSAPKGAKFVSSKGRGDMHTRPARRTHAWGIPRDYSRLNPSTRANLCLGSGGVRATGRKNIFFSLRTEGEKNRAGILISSVSPVQNEAKIENSVKWHRIKVLKKLSEHFFSIFLLNILSETGGSIVITRNCQRISRIAFGRDHQQRWKPPRGNEFLVSQPMFVPPEADCEVKSRMGERARARARPGRGSSESLLHCAFVSAPLSLPPPLPPPARLFGSSGG